MPVCSCYHTCKYFVRKTFFFPFNQNWDFDMFQTLAEILKDTEPGSSFSQLVHDHLP